VKTRLRVDVELEAGVEAALSPEDGHHLVHVLRARPGDPVELVDTSGRRWRGEVSGLQPPTVRAERRLPDTGADPTRELEVWLPLLKGGRTDDLVRQLTELGTTRVVPWVGARSVVRPRDARAAKQLARWRRIAEEATRQCGRADVPEIADIAPLPNAGPGVFFWEGGGTPVSELLTRPDVDGSRLLVGPEGGLTDGEAATLTAAGWTAASLGARVLRAETAVVAAVALWVYGR
jgi:16S rRNA (uracil1498-N3)-methyltransferase